MHQPLLGGTTTTGMFGPVGLVIQAAITAAFWNAKLDLSSANDTDKSSVYNYYVGVALMMFVGFGYLMTFLKAYGIGAVGLTMFITCLGVEFAVLIESYMGKGSLEIDFLSLLNGNFAVAAVLLWLVACPLVPLQTLLVHSALLSLVVAQGCCPQLASPSPLFSETVTLAALATCTACQVFSADLCPSLFHSCTMGPGLWQLIRPSALRAPWWWHASQERSLASSSKQWEHLRNPSQMTPFGLSATTKGSPNSELSETALRPCY